MNKIIVVKCEMILTEIPVEVNDNLMEQILEIEEKELRFWNTNYPNKKYEDFKAIETIGRKLNDKLTELAKITADEHYDTIFDDDLIDNPELKQRFLRLLEKRKEKHN